MKKILFWLPLIAFPSLALTEISEKAGENEFQMEIGFDAAFVADGTGANWRQRLGQPTAITVREDSLADGSRVNVLQIRRPSEISIPIDFPPEAPIDTFGNLELDNSVFVSIKFEVTGTNPKRLGRITLGTQRFPEDDGGERVSLIRDPEGRLMLSVLPSGQYYPFEVEIGEAMEGPQQVVLEFGGPQEGAPHGLLRIWLNPSMEPDAPDPTIELNEFPSKNPHFERIAQPGHSTGLGFNIIQVYAGPMVLPGNGSVYTRLFPVRIASSWQGLLAGSNKHNKQ